VASLVLWNFSFQINNKMMNKMKQVWRDLTCKRRKQWRKQISQQSTPSQPDVIFFI